MSLPGSSVEHSHYERIAFARETQAELLENSTSLHRAQTNPRHDGCGAYVAAFVKPGGSEHGRGSLLMFKIRGVKASEGIEASFLEDEGDS